MEAVGNSFLSTFSAHNPITSAKQSHWPLGSGGALGFPSSAPSRAPLPHGFLNAKGASSFRVRDVDAKEDQRGGGGLRGGEGFVQEDDARDDRDDGRDADEERRAVDADLRDGGVREDKAEDGASKALEEDGVEARAANSRKENLRTAERSSGRSARSSAARPMRFSSASTDRSSAVDRPGHTAFSASRSDVFRTTVLSIISGPPRVFRGRQRRPRPSDAPSPACCGSVRRGRGS